MPRIIVLDNLSPQGLKLLDSTDNIDHEVRTGLKGEDLRTALLEFDGAICRSGVRITADVLEGNQRLKAIARAGAGTDNIDKEAAARSGIVVMNTPGGNTESTAEHTIAMILALSRNLFPAYRSLIEGRWDRKAYMGTELAGKTLGIIGLGRIGQAVAARALGMKIRVLGYDPFLPRQRAEELGIETCSAAEEMLPHVDYLTIHTPLTDETRNIIGAKEIGMMKQGVRLINCARGGLYDEEALAKGLKSGHIGGVALDVYEFEPCTESPLFGMPNVMCTPHLGASTEEAQAKVAVEAAELLINFFATGEIRQAVNMPPIDPTTLKNLRGYLDLARRLGLLLAQVEHSPPNCCHLHYEGEVANKECHLLSVAFAAGLLEHAMESEVGIINAEILLRERGIELVEHRSSEPGDFRSLIRAEVVTDARTTVAAGTLFGNDMPRLVRKGDFQVESRLEGILLLTTHRDAPGAIGRIGEVCGRHQVNIACLTVGRAARKPDGEAIGIFTLDSEPPPEALAELSAMKPTIRVSLVHLPPHGELPPWMGA